jgi:hypothetical protein
MLGDKNRCWEAERLGMIYKLFRRRFDAPATIHGFENGPNAGIGDDKLFNRSLNNYGRTAGLRIEISNQSGCEVMIMEYQHYKNVNPNF